MKDEDIEKLYNHPDKAKSMLKVMEDFIRDSMVIDGDVNFIKYDKFDVGVKAPNVLDGLIFECTDIKRGTFYIGWFK